ncbi:MAG: ribosome small subunit-dependent GTPase A [Saprospiraceae bacterium]|nr:ribosome small subunit-dependent GTPase A [Saprospiraceae bacterium]
MIQGTVIKSTGSWYIVRRTDTQAIVQCRIVGKFRLENMVLTNPVAVGDIVQFAIESEGKGMIKKIMPRTNYVARQSPRRKHDVHLLASNIDQALLFVTIVEPSLKQGFIDRFLLTTEPQEIPTIIGFNKADLYDADDKAIYENMKAIYEKIGYTVLLISATEGVGLDALTTLLTNKITMISGQSGVGKSSVVNGIQPEMTLKTGDISDYSGKGQHTTTFAEMHPLSFGGYLIDTPGIKTLAFNNLEPIQVAHNFREFFALSDDCRFGGTCLHRNEPNCAVLAALEREEISAIRYENYLQILEEVEDQNYWERHTDV